MATNRPDTLDPALLRPGRLDRKIEISSVTTANDLESPNCQVDVELQIFWIVEGFREDVP